MTNNTIKKTRDWKDFSLNATLQIDPRYLHAILTITLDREGVMPGKYECKIIAYVGHTQNQRGFVISVPFEIL